MNCCFFFAALWLTVQGQIDRILETLAAPEKNLMPTGERGAWAASIGTKKFRYMSGRARHSVRADRGTESSLRRARSDARYPASLATGGTPVLLSRWLCTEFPVTWRSQFLRKLQA